MSGSPFMGARVLPKVTFIAYILSGGLCLADEYDVYVSGDSTGQDTSDIGRGYALSNSGGCKIVTPRHVVEEKIPTDPAEGIPSKSDELLLTFRDGSRHSGRIVRNIPPLIHSEIDLALVSLNDDYPCRVSSLVDAATVNSLLESGSPAFLEYIEADGSPKSIPVVVNNMLTDWTLWVRPTPPFTLHSTMSGASLQIQDRWVGMLLSVNDSSGHGVIMRSDRIQEIVRKPGTQSIVYVPDIVAPSFPAERIQVLSDQFRLQLKESGRFHIMKGSWDPSFQAPPCGSASSSCGGSGGVEPALREVRVIIEKTASTRYVISASMVSPQDKEWSKTGLEIRDGKECQGCPIALKNLADVLAGRDNPDHDSNLVFQARVQREIKTLDAHQRARFGITISAHGLKKLRVFESEEDFIRKGDSGPGDIFDDPEQIYDGRASIALGRRLNSFLWLYGEAEYTGTRPVSSTTILHPSADTVLVVGRDSIQGTGVTDAKSTVFSSYDHLNLGIRFKALFKLNSHIGLSTSFSPKAGYLFLHRASHDSAFTSVNAFLNGTYLGKVQSQTESIGKATLGSATFGIDLDIGSEYYLTTKFSVSISGRANWSVAPWLEGKEKGTRISFTRNSSAPEIHLEEESFVRDLAFIRGNFLGTGVYSAIGNPNVGYEYPKGKKVDFERSVKHLTDVGFQLGAQYYF